MRTPLKITLAAAALCAAASAQSIVYVNVAAAAGGNGQTWVTAYNDLQTALQNVSSGDQVWVATGFYVGSFTVPAGVTVMGQFLGEANGVPGYVTPLQRSYVNRTVLSGNRTQRVLTLGAGSVVDGFEILSGQAAAPGGGGALIDGVSATIRNCQFRQNNDSVGAGAAVLVRNAGNLRMENTVVAINGNSLSGAAIDVDGAFATLVNLTIDLNNFSGLRVSNGATVQVHSSIFSTNGIGGGPAYGIERASGTGLSVAQSLFWNNTSGLVLDGATALTTVAQLNGLGYASGNLAADPKYSGPNDWHLQSNSPAIDAGETASPPQRTQDLYDQSRILDGNLDGVALLDIGAAEFSHVTVKIPVDTHQHIHVGVGGTTGLPAFLTMSVSPLPPGLFVSPIGYLFFDPGQPFLMVSYGSIPTAPSQDIQYPPGILPGIVTYWQALTTNGVGVNISNPAIHITN